MPTSTFLERYKILDKIGEGSFSEVLKCLDQKTGVYIAVKRLKKRYESWEDVASLAEVTAWQKVCAHPNILRMNECHYEAKIGSVTLLFDLMDMSLYDYMNTRNRPFLEPRAKSFLFQMLSGLNHLHNAGLFHRDIKPENILIKIPLEQKHQTYEMIKLGDLGSVRGMYSRQPYTEYISTRWYRSPECLLTKGYYDSKMDIWAVGCVFYEMINFKPLFPGANEVDQLAKIHQVLGTPNYKMIGKLLRHKSCNWEGFPKQNGTTISPLISNLSADGQALMRMVIVYDPDQRSSVRKILLHKYFLNLREPPERPYHRRPLSLERHKEKIGDTKSNIPLRKSQIHQPINYKYATNNLTSTTEDNILHTKKQDNYHIQYNHGSKNLAHSEPKNLAHTELKNLTHNTLKNLTHSEPKNNTHSEPKNIPHRSTNKVHFDNFNEIMKNIDWKHKNSKLLHNTPAIMEPPKQRNAFQFVHREGGCKRKSTDDYAYREQKRATKYGKTTSDLPSLLGKAREKNKPLSKSFVLPQNYKKPLESIPELSIESSSAPKRPRLFVLDTALNKNSARYVVLERRIKNVLK